MKKHNLSQFGLVLLGIVLSALLLSNCSSPKNISYYHENEKRIEEYNPNQIQPNERRTTNYSLLNMVRQLPGVNVTGSGSNASIRIRGANSLNLTTEPLFVVNGVPLGHGFSKVANFVDPIHVKSIRVLKGESATIYGARGSNGVIEIITN